MADEWYRMQRWDDEARDEFERRLARARATNRPQYLRIQAVTLMDSDLPELDAAAHLLERLLQEYPDHLETAGTHELLADVARRRSNLALAENHLRQCLDKASATMSMTSGVPDLGLAEALIEQGTEDKVAEAAELLGDDSLQNRIVMRHHAFRYMTARARAAAALDDDERSAEFARRALELASEEEAQFPRHPGVGDVEADEETMRELWRLARA